MQGLALVLAHSISEMAQDICHNCGLHARVIGRSVEEFVTTWDEDAISIA